jgi:hypothetical protein
MKDTAWQTHVNKNGSLLHFFEKAFYLHTHRTLLEVPLDNCLPARWL